MNASASIQYGRRELKTILQKNFVFGLCISITIHLLVVGAYYTAEFLGQDEDSAPTVKVRILKYSDLGPPPSIASVPLAPPVGVASVVKPSVGVPIPVPDAQVSPEQTIATQQELSSTPSPVSEDFGEDGGFQVAPDIVIDDASEPGMDEFIPVEKLPQVVRKVLPKYPEMALRAGMEGTVSVKVLVDTEGKPKKAVVVKSSAEIFNDAAVQAAMQFLFTPAVMNKGPVKVWVALPFRFTLKESSPS